MKNIGVIFILSAPSGGGKTSIAKHLVDILTNLKLSISITTRSPRGTEIDGIDYFFKSNDQFLELIDNKLLLEYTQIYNHYYGTPKATVYNNLENGYDMLFDIDWHGAASIKDKIPNKVVTIFLLPPDIEVLKNRLIARGQDDEETIMYRISNALTEIEHSIDYDYTIVNNDFNKTISEIKNIIINETNQVTYTKK